MIRILESKQVGRLFDRRAARLGEAEAVVRPILDAVRKRGDRALVEYARRLDGLRGNSVRVSPKQLEAAAFSLSSLFVLSLTRASRNIRKFASMQLPTPLLRKVGPG